VALEAAVGEYLEEVKLNRAHKTHLAYKRALGMLVSANPGCDFVQDLERRNLMVNFIRAMKEAGLGDRTQNNLFGAIVTFLHAQDHPIVTRKDAPDYTETETETYSAEELGLLTNQVRKVRVNVLPLRLLDVFSTVATTAGFLRT